MVSNQPARVVLALLVVAASASGLAQSAASPQETVTREQFDRWFEQVKNWGRWGTNGAIGTLNLISSAKRQRAAASVRSGTVVSLAHEFETSPSLNNPSPLKLTVRSEAESAGSDVAWALESLSIEAFHGFANSHMDWLSHTLYRGVLFDGVTSADVRPEGVNLRGVHTLTNGIVTRGVPIDAAELKEVSDPAPGVTITTSDLEAWERKTGVKVEAGDAVLVRTGRWAREGRLGPWKIEGGLSWLTSEWSRHASRFS